MFCWVFFPLRVSQDKSVFILRSFFFQWFCIFDCCEFGLNTNDIYLSIWNINMVLEISWIEQLSQGETLSPLPLEEIRVSAKVGILKIYFIESCASVERIYWALHQIFWVAESLGNPNPSLALNEKTTKKNHNHKFYKNWNLASNIWRVNN